MKNALICLRLDQLKSERSNVEQQWHLKEKFVLGVGDSIYQTLNSENEVDWHNREVFDSTAVAACQSLASSAQSDMTSPALKWFDFKFRKKDMNSNENAKRWLEKCRDIIHEEFQEGNFNVEMSEAFTSLVGIGTTVMVAEAESDLDDWDGINFQNIPTTEIFFDENHKKEVHALYRLLKWTPIQIVTKFGIDNVPKRIRDRYNEGVNDREDVVFAIYPREDKKDADTGKILAPKERPFGFKYVLYSGKNTLGEEGGYYEMPSFVARWTRVQGSKYGYAPGDHAMGDILTLNEVVEASIESRGKVLDPAWLIEERAIVEDLDQGRAQINIVKDINGIKAMESAARFDVQDAEIARLQESIKEAFFVNKMELKESPAMTATEVNARLQRMFKAMSTIVTRIEKELLNPLIERSFNLMYRAGQLPTAPEGIDMGKMDIEYTGPLPKLMRNENAKSIMQFMDWLATQTEIHPDIVDNFNADEAVREVSMFMGVPATMRKTAEETQAIRDERAKQQQQQQKMEMAQMAAQTARDAGAGMKSMQEAGVQ